MAEIRPGRFSEVVWQRFDLARSVRSCGGLPWAHEAPTFLFCAGPPSNVHPPIYKLTCVVHAFLWDPEAGNRSFGLEFFFAMVDSVLVRLGI